MEKRLSSRATVRPGKRTLIKKKRLDDSSVSLLSVEASDSDDGTNLDSKYYKYALYAC
jgi:hypothetical protein